MTHAALYNEIDPYAAEWLDNLIAAGSIAPGRVDRRSVTDLVPADVAGPGQRHFFAGIGVWSYALRLAGVPDDADVWTGSCPCQGLSDAGKRLGTRDPRHLWPAWFALIRECLPPVLFGEQVASRLGLGWLDLVRSDLEGCGYAFGASDICAAGVGAPHIRQRLYFVAVARRERCEGERLHVRQRGPRTGVHETGGGAKLALAGQAPLLATGRGGGEKLNSRAPSPRACWATPVSTELGNTLENYRAMKKNMRSGARTAITHPSLQAQLAAWPTAKQSDAHRGGQIDHMDGRRSNLMDTVETTRGVTSSGSPAPTASRAQLNAAFSLWLMGLPEEWLFAAPSNKPTPRFAKKSTGTTGPARSSASATPSSRSAQRRSSKPRKKRTRRSPDS